MNERRAHQCHRSGCDSPAAYEVHLHVRYGRRHKASEHMVSTIRTCHSKACRKAAHDYLMSDRNKREISNKLATVGRLALDWANAVVEFVPLGEQSWGPAKMQRIGADSLVPLGVG